MSFKSQSERKKIESQNMPADQKAFACPFMETPCCFNSNYHRHPFFEVVWFRKVDAQLVSDFQTHDLKDGTLVFLTPGQVHAWKADFESSHGAMIGISGNRFALEGESFDFLAKLPFFHYAGQQILHIPESRRPFFDQMFAIVIERYNANPAESAPFIAAYLKIILLEAERHLKLMEKDDSRRPAHKLVKQFHDLLESSFSQRHSVQYYADELYVTANHLTETLRTTTGHPPKDIMQMRLMLEAKRLLAHSGDSVAELAHQLSFANPSQFGKWFKKRTDQSPGEFRRLYA